MLKPSTETNKREPSLEGCLLSYRDTNEGPVLENAHIAYLVLTDKTGQVGYMFPNSLNRVAFLRSAAKPFQAIALLQHPNAAQLSPQEWAIICASHAASSTQLKLVKDILQKAQATEADLGCGPHTPFDEETACELVKTGRSPFAIHNNCSGKHAGMLLACKWHNWPIDHYLDPQHPLQQRIFKAIQTASNCPELKTGIDGCGAPVFAMPLNHMAQLWSNLAIDPVWQPVVKAMTEHPEIVGDAKRIDTCIMTVSKGEIIAKVGAEGVLCLVHQDRQEGIAMKVADGNNAARDMIILETLAHLGWLEPDQANTLKAMPQFSSTRLNTQNKPVGSITVSLPSMG